MSEGSLTYLLTVVKSGGGTGTVISSPDGMNCGLNVYTSCESSYMSGISVNLTATAAFGSVFSGWSGEACSGTGICRLTMNGSKRVVANFASSRSLLIVEKSGTGRGTVISSPSSSGIDCGSDCRETYNSNTTVTLNAYADNGSVFAGWSGACSGMGSCSVIINNQQNVTAQFDASPLEEDLFSYYVPLPQSGDHWSCRYDLDKNSCFLWLNQNETQKPCSYLYSDDDTLTDCFTVINPLTSHPIDHEHPQPGDENSTDGSPVNEFQATEGLDESFGKNIVKWSFALSTVRGLILVGYFADLNLSNRDLTGLNATQAEIPDGNFDETVLDKANFTGAALLNTKFRNARGNPNFSDSLLALADFSGERTRLSGSFNRADMANTRLSEAHFEQATFINTNLKASEAIRASFNSSDLQGANFQSADLTFANIDNAVISSATIFYGAKLCQMQGHPIAHHPYTLQATSAFYDHRTFWITRIAPDPKEDAYKRFGLLIRSPTSCIAQPGPFTNTHLERLTSNKILPCTYKRIGSSHTQSGKCINLPDPFARNIRGQRNIDVMLWTGILTDISPPGSTRFNNWVDAKNWLLSLEIGDKRFVIYPVSGKNPHNVTQVLYWAIGSSRPLHTNPATLYAYYVTDDRILADLQTAEIALTMIGSFVPGFNTALSIHDEGIWNIEDTAGSILIDLASSATVLAGVAAKAGKVGITAKLNSTSAFATGSNIVLVTAEAITTGNWHSLIQLGIANKRLARIPFKFLPKSFIRNIKQKSRAIVKAGLGCERPNWTQPRPAFSSFSRLKTSLLAGLSSLKVSSSFWESTAEASEPTTYSIRKNAWCIAGMAIAQACEEIGGSRISHVLSLHVNKKNNELMSRFVSNSAHPLPVNTNEATTFLNRATAESAIGTVMATHHNEIESWLNGNLNELPMMGNIKNEVGKGVRRNGDKIHPSQLKKVKIVLVKNRNNALSGTLPFCIKTAYPTL